VKQLSVYDAIRTHHREALRWQVREALGREHDCVSVWKRDELAGLPRDVRQREKLRLATERAMRRYARERLRDVVRAALESRGNSLRVIKGGKR